MDFKRLILILFLTTHSEGRLYVSNTSSVSPSIDCVLAQPQLHYNGETLTIQNTSGISDVVNDTVWIGYFKALAGFEYIGCGKENNTRQRYVALEDPASCFYFCKSYFGISETLCYCLDDETNLETNPFMEKNCKKCNKTLGVACGSKNHVSIYKINNKDVDHAQTVESCAVLEPRSKGIRWKECSVEGYPTICYNQRTVYNISGYVNWNSAAQNCFNNGSRLATFNESKQININGGSELWIGHMSRLAIFHFNGTNKSPTMFGVLQKNEGTFSVKFQSPENSTQLKSLCVAVDTTSPVTTESSFQPTLSTLPQITTSTFASNTSSSNEISPSDTVKNTHISSSTISRTTEAKYSDVEQSSGVGIPVGVSVAVLLVIVVAVAVVVVIKKRKLRPPNNSSEIKKNAMREEGTNDYIEIPDTNHANGNSPLCNLKIEGHDTCNYAHTYHVLEKDQTKDGKIYTKSDTGPKTESQYNYPDMTDFLQGKVSNQPTDIEHGQYAHTYFVLEEHQKVMDSDDGTYNVTRAHKPKIVQETDNVYNRLDDKNDANYDHIPGSVSKKTASDNVYNSKKNATSVLKPCGIPDDVYNQVSSVGECDTYDHVNKAFEPNGTDNVYGV